MNNYFTKKKKLKTQNTSKFCFHGKKINKNPSIYASHDGASRKFKRVWRPKNSSKWNILRICWAWTLKNYLASAWILKKPHSILVEHQNDGCWVGCPRLHFFLLENFLGASFRNTTVLTCNTVPLGQRVWKLRQHRLPIRSPWWWCRYQTLWLYWFEFSRVFSNFNMTPSMTTTLNMK